MPAFRNVADRPVRGVLTRPPQGGAFHEAAYGRPEDGTSHASIPGMAVRFPYSKITRRVLVAEDDAQMRTLIAEVLGRYGYEVTQADDGDKVITRVAAQYVFREASFDLIVCDIRMPGRSGVDVLKSIRAGDLRIPVIVMTAFGDREIKAEVEALGAVFFDKPFDMADLRAAVAKLLSDAASARP